jgi:ABC-2 type transport system permease protein
MMCIIFKCEETSRKILNFFINIFALLGGVFFSLDGYGRTVSFITKLSPVKWVLDGVFKIIYDRDLSYLMPTSVILLVLTAAMLGACKIMFRTEDYV